VRAGFSVKSVGIDLKNSYATCSRNVKIVPDTLTLPTSPTADILILPGGTAGAETFSTNSSVQSLIRSYRDAGKYIGVICAATTALVASVGAAGKTEGLESAKKVKVTSHPAVKDEVVQAGWEYSEERVVVDGKVVSSRGPGTAMGFALTIVEVLAGKEKRNEVHGPMLAALPLRA
jgi:protein DJ-1